MTTFGSRLRDLRIRKGINQKELSELLKISKSAVSMYERDEREPSFELLERIADFFEVSLDYLIRGEDYHSKAEELLHDPETQVAARDGEMTEERALEALKWILEREEGRKPGQRQKRRK